MLKRSLFKGLSILFFTVFFQNLAFSCICDITVPLCDHASIDNEFVLVEVLQEPYTTNDMQVKIIETLHTPFPKDTILIFGSNGANCNESLNSYSPGDTLVLALYFEHNGYWSLSHCGEHSLLYDNGDVIGNITSTISVMPYQQLKQNMFSCFNGTVASEQVNPRLELNLYPNPTTAVLNVDGEHSILEYEVFNSVGQQIAFKALENNRPSIQINTESFDDGIYCLRLRTSKGIITRKFLKVSTE